ncbi:hypothetical protein ACFWAY_36075 [Rhodococcus sp. NPDC059968]|uniref:hypothetical protein n=1 Tax=Rhodococcus sp. NPDC059968 TaxID=3347017 RepID=UPI00367156C3
MTFDAMAEDSDVAQARIFLGHLDAEIDIVAARSETVDALAEHARRAHRPTDRLRRPRPCEPSCTRCTDSSMRACSGFPR